MHPDLPSPSSLKEVTPTNGVAYRLTERDISRIWAKVAIDANGCWTWTAYRFPSGYGRTAVNGSWSYTHRLMYMAFVGVIPQGWHTDHLCRKPSCCNPAHLEAVTPRMNIHRSPIAPAARNAQKTHCNSGHELSGENLIINVRGNRVCKTCSVMRAAESYARKTGSPLDVTRPGKRPKTHCVNGHALDEANTYLDPRGARRCRTCAREQQRNWQERQSKP